MREKDNIEIEGDTLGDERFFELTKKYLKEALAEQGIGAKSAVGYGYFNKVEEQTATNT